MKKIDEAIENYFAPKKSEPFGINSLVEMINEEISKLEGVVLTEADDGSGRFSVTLSIPKLVPSEAWGDPDSQSRKEINKVFESISGGQDIEARLASINKFLTPSSAKKKTSPRVIINMMQITEALQATLNDYNESAAGFVFEGFMAALTGGKQIAGKIAGTLPIEDFVAFSEFGANVPVSLKLLSPTTGVKGSFTNIVDFLLYRKAPEIKYLVAYKLTSGENVEKLKIFAFDITRENFIDFISGVSGNNLSGVNLNQLKKAMAVYNQDPSDENLVPLAKLMIQTRGYTKKGFLNQMAATGERAPEKSPEEEEEAELRRQAGREKAFTRVGAKELPSDVNESLDLLLEEQMSDKSELTLNETFHWIEKQTLLTESSESQWEASWPQLERTAGLTNLQRFGELDLSQSNIDELVQIYSKILSGGLKTLLGATKSLTENIGEYYSERSRAKAQAAGEDAKADASSVVGALEEDPRFSEKDTE